jgi:hypothetical protein
MIVSANMKKIAVLILFALVASVGFSQLTVTVTHDGKDMFVQFPGGQSVEYTVLLVDPINPGALELQKGTLQAQGTSAVNWEADLRYVYEVRYRYPMANGELSEWFAIDPKSLLNAEGR